MSALRMYVARALPRLWYAGPAAAARALWERLHAGRRAARAAVRGGSQTRWWLISHHRGAGVDAFVWGPFRSEDAAWDFPNTFLGWVDAPGLRATTFDLRVESTPRGDRPTLITECPEPEPTGALDLYLSTGAVPTGRTAEILRLAQESHDRRMRGRDDVG